MASRTAQLIAQLVDRVSGPAKGMAGALDGVAAAGKRLGKGMASPALDKLTKDLKEAQAQAEKLAQLQNRMKSLATSRGAFNTARTDVERISRDLEAARKSAAAGDKEAIRSVRELERAQARARSTVRSSASAFEAEAEAVKRLRRELATLGIPMTSLATAQGAVAARAKAAAVALERQTRAEKRVRAADALAVQAQAAGAPAKGGRGGGILAGIGGRVGGGLIGGYGAYQAAGVYKQAAAFDRRITMIGQTADAARPEIDRLASSVHDLAQETATPVDKLAGGLEALVAQGRNLKEAMDFLPSVARTAAASGAEVDDIAKSADSVASNFNIAGKEMQSAFDIMAAGGKAGQFELKDMSRYLPSLAPAAKAVGLAGQQGLSDIVAMLQVIRKGSGSSEEAATSLTNIFQKMESEETAKKFKKMGVDLEAAMKKGRKEGRNLIEVFEEAAQQATKGDLSRLPNLIADQEFGRGVRALMTYRGEWQKLSATLRETSGGTVAKDVVQVTKDAQSAVDRLSNSAQRGGQAVARFMDSAFGTSDRIQNTAQALEAAAQAIEKINDAYAKGGLAGVAKFLKDAPVEAAKEALAKSLPDRKTAQDAQINAMEEDLAATEITMTRSGRSKEQIDGVLRSKRAALAAAKRAKGDLNMEGAGMRSLPPSMLADPTAGIRGEAGAVGSGLYGGAFQQAFPIDLSKSRALPGATPLPPQRPVGMPSWSRGDDLKDQLQPEIKPKLDLSGLADLPTITPKVDASAVTVLGDSLDTAKTKGAELGAMTIKPNIDGSGIGTIVQQLQAAIGLVQSLNGGMDAAKGKAAALGGAMGRTGRVTQTFGNSPSAGEN